jgi:hypothetical protein
VKPIRLRRDDVLHTVHTSATKFTVASGAEAARSIANPNGFGWPSCWACTQRRMDELKGGAIVGRFGEATFVPVEEYLIVEQRAEEEDLRARCTHGNPGGRVFEDTKVLTMPKTWSEVKKRHKRAGLIFFVESAALPVGGNLVLL